MNELGDEEDADYVFKVIMSGSHSVGKTLLINRYTKNEFDIHSVTTIGIENIPKKLKIKDKTIISNIWDTIGEEKFKSITSIYYKGAVGAILVYGITKKKTFSDICGQWLSELKCNWDSVVTMLVGNKCDLEDQREVPTDEATAFAKEHGKLLLILGMFFMETSAKNSTNVMKAFTVVFEDIFDNNVRSEISNDTKVGKKVEKGKSIGGQVSGGKKLSNTTNNKKSGCC